MSVPPPQGISDDEYDAIEAAVSETARGRRFLIEFARRNRVAETRLLLDAMARLEAAVSRGPSRSVSIRLLAQRVAEIATKLDDVADEMRASGVEEHLSYAIAAEARAVSGLLRTATSSARESEPAPRMPAARVQAAALPPADARQTPTLTTDPRLAALAPLAHLSLPEKLALFR